MQTPPSLTDRPALLRNRKRFAVTFLHDAVAVEIKERLAEVNRTFTTPAIVTGLPEFWRGAWPEATIVPDDEVLGLDPGAHDLVIHALTLHWANDPVGQLVQCRHALRPDGLLIAVLFGGQTLHEAAPGCLITSSAVVWPLGSVTVSTNRWTTRPRWISRDETRRACSLIARASG